MFWKIIKVLKVVLDIIGEEESDGGEGEEKKERAIERLSKKGLDLSIKDIGEVIDHIVGIINMIRDDGDEE